MYMQMKFSWPRSVDLRRSILQPDVLKGDSAEYVRAEYLKTLADTEKIPGESKKEAADAGNVPAQYRLVYADAADPQRSDVHVQRGRNACAVL